MLQKILLLYVGSTFAGADCTDSILPYHHDIGSDAIIPAISSPMKIQHFFAKGSSLVKSNIFNPYAVMYLFYNQNSDPACDNFSDFSLRNIGCQTAYIGNKLTINNQYSRPQFDSSEPGEYGFCYRAKQIETGIYYESDNHYLVVKACDDADADNQNGHSSYKLKQQFQPEILSYSTTEPYKAVSVSEYGTMDLVWDEGNTDPNTNDYQFCIKALQDCQLINASDNQPIDFDNNEHLYFYAKQSKFQLMAARNIVEGFSYNLKIKCGNVLTTNSFTVTQVSKSNSDTLDPIDCPALECANNLEYDFEFEYDSIANSQEFSFDNVFSNDGDRCSQTCQIYDAGSCGIKQIINYEHLSIEGATGIAQQGVDAGYCYLACVRCTLGTQIADLDNILITQAKRPITCESVLSNATASDVFLLFQKAVPPQDLLTDDFDTIFNNQDTENCGIQFCKIYEAGKCGTELTVDEVFTNPKTVKAKVNTVDGFSLSVCLGCTTGKYSAYLDNWKITQCKQGEELGEDGDSCLEAEVVNTPPVLRGKRTPWILENLDSLEKDIVEFISLPIVDLQGDPIDFTFYVNQTDTTFFTYAEIIKNEQQGFFRTFTLSIDRSLVNEEHHGIHTIYCNATDGELETNLEFKLFIFKNQTLKEKKEAQEERKENREDTSESTATQKDEEKVQVKREKVVVKPKIEFRQPEAAEEEVEKPKEEKKILFKIKKSKPLPEPGINIGKISPLGDIPIEFNQPFKVPQEGFDYSQTFEIAMVSSVDGSIVYGSYAGTNSRRLSEDECADCDSAQKAFSWGMAEHNDLGMNLQLHFENEDAISTSSYGQDQMTMAVKDYTVFQSSVGNKTLTNEGIPKKDCGDGSTAAMCKLMPQIMTNEDTVNSITDGAANFGSALNTVTILNMLAVLLAGAAVQQLFGMVRIIQLLLLSAVLGVVYPAHLTLFYSYCVKLAGMDIFQGASIYEALFEFKETEPLNEVFEQYEIGDMNFFMNSGSLLLMVFFMIINYFGASFFLKLAKRFYTFKLCRKLGIKADSNNQLRVPLMTLFIELYIDIVLSSFLNVVAIWREQTFSDHFNHFSNKANFLNSSIALIAYVMVFLAPLYITYVINNNRDTLNDEVTLDRYGIFYAEFNFNRPYAAYFTVHMMLRRLILISILVFLTGMPWLQAQLILVLSLINLCFIWAIRPYADKLTNKIEIFNECTVYINSLLHLQFLQESNDFKKLQQVKSLLGWLIICNVGINIATNIAIVSLQMTIEAAQGMRENIHKLHLAWRKYQERRLQKTLREAFGDEILPENKDIAEKEAIMFCKDFALERDWCHKHAIDYRQLDEEQTFQQHIINFGFDLRRRQIAKEIKISKQIHGMKQMEFKQAIQGRLNERRDNQAITLEEASSKLLAESKFSIDLPGYWEKYQKDGKEQEVFVEVRIKKLPSSIRQLKKLKDWKESKIQVIQEHAEEQLETERDEDQLNLEEKEKIKDGSPDQKSEGDKESLSSEESNATIDKEDGKCKGITVLKEMLLKQYQPAIKALTVVKAKQRLLKTQKETVNPDTILQKKHEEIAKFIQNNNKKEVFGNNITEQIQQQIQILKQKQENTISENNNRISILATGQFEKVVYSEKYDFAMNHNFSDDEEEPESSDDFFDEEIEDLVRQFVEVALQKIIYPKEPKIVAEGSVFLSQRSEVTNSVQYCLLEIEELQEALDDEESLSRQYQKLYDNEQDVFDFGNKFTRQFTKPSPLQFYASQLQLLTSESPQASSLSHTLTQSFKCLKCKTTTEISHSSNFLTLKSNVRKFDFKLHLQVLSKVQTDKERVTTQRLVEYHMGKYSFVDFDYTNGRQTICLCPKCKTFTKNDVQVRFQKAPKILVLGVKNIDQAQINEFIKSVAQFNSFKKVLTIFEMEFQDERLEITDLEMDTELETPQIDPTYGNGRYFQVNKEVLVDLNLDLAKFVPQGQKSQYQLFGLIEQNHCAFVLKNEKWYKHSEFEVNLVTQKVVQEQKQPRMLFYRQII